MPIRRLTSNSVADTSFFTMLSEFNNLQEKDLSNATITLVKQKSVSNDKEQSIHIGLADIFLFNELIVHYETDETKDHIEISYKASSAYHLHSLVVYLSNKFPHLIFNNKNELCDAIAMLAQTVEHRMLSELDGSSEHTFFLEESADNQYVNIVCDSDCYLKLDLLDQRFLILYGGKLGLGSLHFLPTHAIPTVLSYLNSMFNTLDIDKQLDHEGLVGYE